MVRFARTIRAMVNHGKVCFRIWTKAGIWENIFTTLIERNLVDEATLMPDSTTVKVNQHTSGAKREIPRGKRTKQRRFTNKSPCGNG